MKAVAFSIFVCLTLNALAAGPQRKIAFERADSVWVANVDGTAAKKIAAGDLPDISPDGTRLAFNTDEDSKTRPGPERHIAVADLANGKVTIIKDIPSDNCFGPVWSPDGSKLAFSIMAEKEWRLGLVNADGSGFHFVKNAAFKGDAFGAPTWSADGRSIFATTWTIFIRSISTEMFSKNGKLTKVLTEASMNSNDRLSVAPDGNTLLMDADTGAERERKNWDGPQPAVYEFDLATEKTRRVSGKNDYVWDPCWLTNGEFLCLIQKENEKEASLYRMSIDGKNPKLLIKQARTPSVNAP
jgi:TolB protein